MTLAGILTLLQSTGFLHLLFSTLSVLLPQATKEQPVWFVVRKVIDWAALNVGNAENLPRKGTSPALDDPSNPSKVSEKPFQPLHPLQPSQESVTPVDDKQAGNGSDVPKFPN